jgi:putative glutamine amidotransferase
MLPGYMRSIETAGGIPAMLPLTADRDALKRLAELFSGFIFTGGQDVSPSLYGEEKTRRCGAVSLERDAMETMLFEEAILTLDKPALGICRGIQLFNAILGGSLYQDIPSQLPGATRHTQDPPRGRPVHIVELTRETPLYKLLGKDAISVNSFHHQGIKKLSPRLIRMARSWDGLPEAAYMPEKHFVWAVQWHPELSSADETSKRIFAAFVAASA